ncbi:MAG: porin family protein [Chlorobaculum sp.]|nr:porin family protein [Chlorobaculum sp.]
MKNGFLALMLAGVCLIPSLSLADTPYVSVSFGGAELNNSRYTYYGSNISNAIVFKESMTYGGAIGLRGDGYRLEAAYGHQQNKADKISKQLIPNSYTFIPVQGTGDDKVSINSYMVNGYLDMDQDASIDPYVMTGIGLVNIKASGPTMYSASSTVFAWQFGLGASIKVSEHLLIDLGFRYLKPSNYTSTELENLKVSNSSKNLMTGLQYVF